MASIIHDLRIESPRSKVIEALTTREGLAAWWTKNCTVDGDHAEFPFDDGAGSLTFRFDSRGPDKVALTCVANRNDPEWQDTLLFDLKDGHGAVDVHFVHVGWQTSDSDYFKDCSDGWGYFMKSLKAYLETETGTPVDG